MAATIRRPLWSVRLRQNVAHRWETRSQALVRSSSSHTGQDVALEDASSSPAPSLVIGKDQLLQAARHGAAAVGTSIRQDSLVHVKLSYLFSNTKTPPPSPRAGDIKDGRIRPIPAYIPLSSHVFDVEPRRDLIHASVVYYLDGQRSGTASTKTRGETSYSGAKIRPQKGTGQARLGTRGNPLLRGGGVIHGPKPRDMSSKLNRRVRELALRSALSAKWRQGDLFVVKSLKWDRETPKTRVLEGLLKSKKWTNALFLTAPRQSAEAVTALLPTKINRKPSALDPKYSEQQTGEHDEEIANFLLASRNIASVQTIQLNKMADEKQKKKEPMKPSELHAYDVVKKKILICDLGAVEWLEEKLGGSIFHEDEAEQVEQEMLKLNAETGRDASSEGNVIDDDIIEQADAAVESLRGAVETDTPSKKTV